jgi:hypothetical protein
MLNTLSVKSGKIYFTPLRKRGARGDFSDNLENPPSSPFTKGGINHFLAVIFSCYSLLLRSS